MLGEVSPGPCTPGPLPLCTRAACTDGPSPHQLITLIVVVQQWLLEWPPGVGVCGRALEVSGSELGEFILGEIFLILVRQGQGCVQVLFHHLPPPTL